jgi:hypothetical protein
MKNVFVFKYGVSRGQDTYGYNIVSLYVDNKKVASTCGGGYDMNGCVLGQWINQTFGNELRELCAKEIAEAQRELDQYKFSGIPDEGLKYYNDRGNGIYGLIVTGHKIFGGIARIDGMCGFSVCKQVLKVLGYELEYITDTDKESIYQLHTQIN